METAVNGRLVEVSVVMNYERQPIYRRQRDGQYFVAGKWGSTFQLQVRNLTNGRLEILNSVDGRNTLIDEPADLRSNRGMIVSPRDTWTIRGWRLNDHNVADFVFTDPTSSVENMATGQNPNAGVFGFAVYTEKYSEPVVFRSLGATRGGSPQTMGGTFESVKGADLGTGMGNVQSDQVGRTSFTRSGQPPEVITIQYRSIQWLQRNGITIPDEPNAFPGGETGYNKYRSS